MQNIEQIYTNCLAQGSYFIESNGEAAVIDPLRETDPYIDRAIERGVTIKYIFETHFHADFVSGHIDLAKKTGATIVYGPTAVTSFEKHEAFDGEEFKVGDIIIRVLHTPGHTPESSSFLLIDNKGKEKAIFTGDTLFIGDVGRPDLAQKATKLTQEDLAGWLFDSLRKKIMPLPDNVIVYPAHGAGSACGKNMSSETWDTLGNQKATNYALRADMTKSEFIDEVTAGLTAPPQYFAMNAALNKKGYGDIDEVMETGMRALSVVDFKLEQVKEDVLVLDVRGIEDFVKGFIPGSLFIGLDGSFAPWVGALITNIKQKILLVTPVGREEEAVRRLARVGYDNSIGYLDGGFESWQKAGEEVAIIKSIKIEKFGKNINKIDGKIIDVRKPGEYESTHLEGAISLPLDNFPKKDFSIINKDEKYYVHCRSGFRSTIAASLLYKNGFMDIVDVIGDFDLLKELAVSLKGNCPSLVG
jgi:glyoxylase-like metal-dependent hydrolase (beta-lactamase superfamily II)/rhodanese-related sulfurtransferase